MKRIAILFAVFLSLAADQPSDAAKKDLDKLQGEWKAEKAQRGGKDVAASDLEKLKLTFKGDSLTIDVGDARLEKAAIVLNPSKAPATIDLKSVRAGGDTALGIYKLDGNTLTICWAKEGERPTEFASTSGAEQVLMVLKRVKK